MSAPGPSGPLVLFCPENIYIFFFFFVSNVRQLIAADDFCRRLQQTTFSDAFFSWCFNA